MTKVSCAFPTSLLASHTYSPLTLSLVTATKRWLSTGWDADVMDRIFTPFWLFLSSFPARSQRIEGTGCPWAEQVKNAMSSLLTSVVVALLVISGTFSVPVKKKFHSHWPTANAQKVECPLPLVNLATQCKEWMSGKYVTLSRKTYRTELFSVYHSAHL